jgi:acyl-CoA oxidase
MALMAWRVTRLGEAGTATPGQVSMAKAWNTLRGREVCSLGRELLGGNGIVLDFHVAKVFNDMEAAHT